MGCAGGAHLLNVDVCMIWLATASLSRYQKLESNRLKILALVSPVRHFSAILNDLKEERKDSLYPSTYLLDILQGYNLEAYVGKQRPNSMEKSKGFIHTIPHTACRRHSNQERS